MHEVHDRAQSQRAANIEQRRERLPRDRGGFILQKATANPPCPPFLPARGTPVGAPLLRSDPFAVKGGNSLLKHVLNSYVWL